jgi:hypothetical protein
LFLAAVGVLTQFLTGVPGFPKIPPGPIILAVAAVVVALVRWRWAPAVGLFAALFLTVGFLAAGAGGRLTNPTELGPFLGTWSQVIGQVIALLAGVISLVIAAARIRRVGA